jgi:hypothetical protein
LSTKPTTKTPLNEQRFFTTGAVAGIEIGPTELGYFWPESEVQGGGDRLLLGHCGQWVLSLLGPLCRL